MSLINEIKNELLLTKTYGSKMLEASEELKLLSTDRDMRLAYRVAAKLWNRVLMPGESNCIVFWGDMALDQSTTKRKSILFSQLLQEKKLMLAFPPFLNQTFWKENDISDFLKQFPEFNIIKKQHKNNAWSITVEYISCVFTLKFVKIVPAKYESNMNAYEDDEGFRLLATVLDKKRIFQFRMHKCRFMDNENPDA